MKKIPIFTLLTVLLIGIGSCTQPTGNVDSLAAADVSSTAVKGQSAVMDNTSEKNILQVAAGSRDHTTLVAAVKAAGLEDVLVNAGPLTVFAPTNEAFAKLPEGTVENLLKPENKATLARIIKYHAAPGTYRDNLLKDGMNLYQASGHYVKVSKNGDMTNVGGANILGTVAASNGVVHVVDAVMLPPDN